jgi:hypothetical protein
VPSGRKLRKYRICGGEEDRGDQNEVRTGPGRGSLTGILAKGGFLTPLPRFSSWNWMSCEMSCARDLAVGGSDAMYWTEKNRE